jgi:hypothetical protein
MDAGRVRLGFTMIGTFVHAEHDVSPHEPEPGVAPDQQPHRHLLDMTLLEWDFDAQIAFSRRFAFEAFLPVRLTVIGASFEDADGNDLPDATSIHHRDENIAGLGDVVLGGRIALVLPENVPRWQLDLRLGASLPTGHTEADPFARGERGLSHQHIFFGSGTVDPVLGLESNVALDKLGITAWLSSRVPLYRNRFGYRHSRSVVAGVGVFSGFGLRRWTFLAQPEVFFETPASWPAREAPNSGRTSLIATAGVFVRPTEPVQLHLLLKVPYYTRSHGGQLRWPIVALVGATVTFDVRPRAQAASPGGQ